MKFLHPATVDLISSSSPNPIDMIGQIDSGFGLLSTIAKINEYHEADNPNLDLRDFVIDLRKKMACEESFCGKDHTASEKFELSKIQQSERLITKKVETHNLQADHRTRIWPKQYHDEWNPLGNGKYQVKKIFSEIKEQPLLVPEIHNILNKPNINYSKTLTKYLVQHANCITDPELFLSRFNFTSKFLRHSAHIFEYGKIRDGLGELSNKYDIEMSFPLVGALRIGEEKIGFYMISYCRTESDMPEKTVWEEIDKIMSPVFKRETAQEILYKCKKEFGCLTNHMYLKRMVVKSKSVQNSFVIFHFGVFSNTIMQEADLPIDLLYRYINNDLREWWNAYSPPGVSSWEQIPISDNVAK